MELFCFGDGFPFDFPHRRAQAHQWGMQPVGAVGFIAPEIELRGSFWVSEASERSHVDVMQDLMIGCKQLLK